MPFGCDSDDNEADQEDNSNYLSEEENELNEMFENDNDSFDEDEDIFDVDIMDTSFNRDGEYVSHGNGISVQTLDIPPW